MNRRVDDSEETEGMDGKPVRELRELAEETGEGFVGRVERSILRRRLAADVTDYAWWAPFRILLEYLGMLLAPFTSQSKGDGDS